MVEPWVPGYILTKGERVGAEIARRIRLIKLPSGQRISQTAVTRTDRNPELAGIFPAVTIQEASDRYAVQQYTGQTRVVAEVPLIVAVERASDEQKAAALRDLWFRIIRVLMFDRGEMTGNLGRLVEKIEPVDMLPAIPGPESGCALARFTYRVQYSYPSNDPTRVPSDFQEVDPW